MNTRGLSLLAALLAFALLSAANLAVFRSLEERARLESRNDAERTMNLLFAGLRDYPDFGQAAASLPALAQKVVGVGAYGGGGKALYLWGKAPPEYVQDPGLTAGRGEQVRQYIESRADASLVLLLGPMPPGPPLPPPRGAGGEHSFFFATLRDARVLYLEIAEPTFWGQRRLQSLLLPLVELALLGLVLFVRALLLRNAEYRRRIEEQKNLVILGTAASTLAHEIKNPLLSIRLQTGILEKTGGAGLGRELGIINDEVERLSALSHRVNDYLRDPRGSPQPLDPRPVAAELGRRRLGRDLVFGAGLGPGRLVDIDPERLRSILENLLQNALESGGPEEGLGIALAGSDRSLCIDVLDRGPGIAPGLREQVFDPFFTTKSRGSGIGLAISKRFALAAGGSIEIHDREGGGACLRLLLPTLRAGGDGPTVEPAP